MNEYRKQYASRNKKLASMGMTYAEYLKSPHWFLVKTLAKREIRFQSCHVCGSKEDLQLHHRKYKKIHKLDKVRLQLNYLTSLCRKHHFLVHEQAKRTGKGLSSSVKKVKKRYEKSLIHTPVILKAQGACYNKKGRGYSKII